MKGFCLVLVLPAALAFAGADSLRSQIEAMNKSLRMAMLRKDVAAFEKAVQGRFTRDFKHTAGGQTMTADQLVATMRMGMTSMSKITVYERKLVSLKESGDRATATTDQMMTGIQTDAQKKSHKFVWTGVSVDTYRKEGGKWKIASMTWKSQKMTVDGKPVAL